MRVRNNRLVRRLLPALLAALGIAAGAAPRAHAAAYTYATRQRTINAGVLVVDDGPGTSGAPSPNSGNWDNVFMAAQTASDPDPYVFYILNQRQDLKPFGWNIVNPIAPATVTGDILARWNDRTVNDMNGTPVTYALNQTITPNMAAYWEVSLSKTSLMDLEKFDVLLLDLRGHTAAFTDNEVNALRRYVDNGGQLWIESSGGGNISATYPTFLNLTFAAGTAGSLVVPPVDGYSVPQPIIATPYLLSQFELNGLGTPNGGAAQSLAGASGALDPLLSIAAQTSATTPVVAAGQYGAGQVIVDSLGSAANINNSLPGLNPGFGLNSGPYCDPEPADALSVPGADLKFAYDILSWAGAHPNQYKNSHQSSQSAATLGPALTSSWTYTLPNSASGSTPGAAINGSFVYVRTADGVLRALNATPGTDIIGTGVPDAGFPDYVNGTPYDEVWDTAASTDGFPGIPTMSTAFSVDTAASAPTVATVLGNGTEVFIESAKGQVYMADAATGAGVLLGPKSSPGTFATVAPAPTYFDGRLYAGEPDGSLFVYDFSTSKGAAYSLGSTGESAVAPPTVGLVHESVNATGTNSVNGSGYVDDVVVTVTTNAHTYTVHAGARHDPLSGSDPYTPAVANSTGTFSLQAAGLDPFYDDVGGYQNSTAYTFPSPPTNYIATAAVPPTPPIFGDYDVDFTSGTTTQTPAGTAVRAVFAVGPPPAGSTTSPNGIISAPALDSNGNFYYTVNIGADSTIVCAHEGRSGEASPPGRFSQTQMLWRFRLPFTTEPAPVDADGNTYGSLAGGQFVGNPVVDNQGNVFALATVPVSAANPNGGTAVLCFNATYSPYLTLPVNSTTGTVSISQIEQPVNGTADEFGNPVMPVVTGGTQQYSTVPDSNGNVTIQSFGGLAASGTPIPSMVPNLSEPQSAQVTYTQTNNAGTVTSTVTGLFHTNLLWYAILPGTTLTANAGLTQVGNYLFFPGATPVNGVGTTGILRLYAYPQSASLVATGRTYNLAGTTPDGRSPFSLAAATPQIGAVQGVLSAGNGVLVANGTGGVEAFGTKYTLVADAGRVLEVDNEGAPSWLVDATTQSNTTTKRATHVALNHPTAITQVTSNDYLIADTGNNRCVRFDRAGNVLWELTRFNDQELKDASGTDITYFTNTATDATGNPNATKKQSLLAPGEPLTLNHPTSVASYIQTVKNSSNVIQGTLVHYLIADTGNHRILEVVDAFDQNGTPVGVPHDLVWISRTYDALGRRYDYTSANYFVGPDTNAYIVALVSNARIAPLPQNPRGVMLPARQDAPGSSIVLLDYDPSLAVPASQKDGYLHQTVSSFLATLYNTSPMTGQFDLADSPVLEQTGPTTYQRAVPSANAPAVSAITLRNPRSMETYTPPGTAASGGVKLQNILLADDNGVWDLFFNSSGQLEAQWGFTQADYQNVLSANGTQPQVPGPGQTRSALGLPFVPNSIQRIGTDPVVANGTTYLLGHYLVTNGYSQGEVGPAANFGGEVLELADQSPSALQTNLVSSFSKLGIAAPLSQPASATQEK